jgi:hypothetical protein
MARSLEELQILAQLIDNIGISIEKLEKAYGKKDAESFNKSKEAILDFKNKISEILK